MKLIDANHRAHVQDVVVLELLLPSVEANKLERKARRSRRTIGETIRILIRDYIERPEAFHHRWAE